jgi:hypothetical protein
MLDHYFPSPLYSSYCFTGDNGMRKRQGWAFPACRFFPARQRGARGLPRYPLPKCLIFIASASERDAALIGKRPDFGKAA